MSETFTPIGDLVASGSVSAAGALADNSSGVASVAHAGTGVYGVILAPGSQINRANANVKVTLRDDSVTPVAADQPNWSIVVGGGGTVFTLEVRTYVGGTPTDRAFNFEITRRAIGGV